MSKLNFEIEAAAKIIKRKFPIGIDLINTGLMDRLNAVLYRNCEGKYCYAVFNTDNTKLLVDFFQSCDVSIERIESDWCDFSLAFEFTFLDDLATVIGRLK